MSSFLWSICARSQSFLARSTPIAPISTAACASSFSCGREPFFSSASRASLDATSAVLLLDIGGQRLPLPLHRRSRACASCDCAEASAADFAFALRQQLIAIEARDHLALLHRVAFVDGALDQLARPS